MRTVIAVALACFVSLSHCLAEERVPVEGFGDFLLGSSFGELQKSYSFAPLHFHNEYVLVDKLKLNTDGEELLMTLGVKTSGNTITQIELSQSLDYESSELWEKGVELFQSLSRKYVGEWKLETRDDSKTELKSMAASAKYVGSNENILTLSFHKSQGLTFICLRYILAEVKSEATEL